MFHGVCAVCHACGRAHGVLYVCSVICVSYVACMCCGLCVVQQCAASSRMCDIMNVPWHDFVCHACGGVHVAFYGQSVMCMLCVA